MLGCPSYGEHASVQVQGDLPRGRPAGETYRPARVDHTFRPASGRGCPAPPPGLAFGLARLDGRDRSDDRGHRGADDRSRGLAGDESLKLLLDTHIWFWSLAEPDRLRRTVRAAIRRTANELWVSPISAWELLVLAERGRVELGAEPHKWVTDALARIPAQEAALTFDVAIRSREIMSVHPDPADRFLVATALVYGLTLVTADELLIKARACPLLANH
jgi:PIN domain nuclease of toxin-antitoxin system